MKNALKITGACFALILVLCITINGRTIFAHIYSVLSPMTITVQDATERLISASYRSTSDYTHQLFDNSVPKVKDSVKAGLAAPRKGEPLEDISVQEKQELDQLIKTHR